MFRSLAFAYLLTITPLLAHAHGDEMHGNHDAHHGGFVMMYTDLHFEVVAPAAGGLKLYFTDAMRADLPAAAVSDVELEVQRPGAKAEAVRMTISKEGDCWVGRSAPITDDKTIIRVAFVSKGEPVQINMISASLPKPGVELAKDHAVANQHDH